MTKPHIETSRSTPEKILTSLQGLLLQILNNLGAKHIPYAALTSHIEGPPDTFSDVDLVLESDPRADIEPILIEMQNQGDLDILQRQHYEVPFGYAYFLKSCRDKDQKILQLDCLFDPYGISYMRRATPALLKGVGKEWWGYRVNDTELALYLLCKRAYKTSRFNLKLDSSQLGDLQKVLQRADKAELDKKARWLWGEESGELLEGLRKADTVAEAEAIITKVWEVWEKYRWYKQPLLELRRVGHNFLRLARRLLQPVGLFIVLVGPDGCGKSTLAEALEKQSSRPYRGFWRFHWRPGLLPKLSQNKPKPEGFTIPEPPREAAYGTLVSLVRYLYYLTDFMMGYWVRIHSKKAAATLIIGERWHYDVMVNPQRYGFQLPRWFLQLGHWFVPQPDLVFLLTAKPEVIHARKPELAIEEIGAQITAFRTTLAWKPRVVEVDTGVEVPETTQQVREAILEETARITRQHLCIKPEWQGFGRRSDPKVWRHRNEKAAPSLRLYHPASVIGRLIKLTASLAPGPLANLLFFRASPSLFQAAELRQHLQMMRHVLGEPQATASFGTGTPGPHRKMVAQLSVGEFVHAYVKVGNGATLAKLLDTESRALAIIGGLEGAPFQAPKVIADVRKKNYRYLFLSSPEAGAQPRSLKPDRLDHLFLSYWAGLESSKFPVEAILVRVPPIHDLRESEKRIFTDAHDFVLAFFQEVGVRVWPSHGDYAPWNTLLLEGGRLYVFDWEYFDEQAPALQDVFHRVFMPARLVEGLSPAQIVRHLLRVREHPVFGPVVEGAAVKEKELPAYALLYILEMVRRQGVFNPAFLSYLTACMERILLKVRYRCRRPKILVSAYACEPGKGSEPGVGWNWVQAIAKHADAWVITRGNNRGPIEKELGSETRDGLNFEYVELPRWLSFWKKGQRGIRLYYYLWQFSALVRTRQLLRTHSFDLAHHVTFVNDWVWTFLALLPFPFIWGPIGSHPKMLRQILESRSDWLLDTGRCAVQALVRSLDPLYYLSVREAAKILCINDTVAHSFPLLLKDNEKIVIEPAIAIEGLPEATNRLYSVKKRGSLRVLFVGRFVVIKGPDLVLEAFAKFVSGSPEARLTMLGEGPLDKRLRQKAISLGIADKLTLVPWLPRDEALQLYREHDVFLFPSMEGGGMVVLEAMAAGLPVVCLDFGGPGRMVTPEVGIKVKIGQRSDVIQGLADGLNCISQEAVWSGSACRERIRKSVHSRFSWEAKERLIAELYRSVI